NIFTIERRNKALVQLGHDRVGRLVTAMFDGLHLFDPGLQVVGIFQNAAQQARTLAHAGGKLGKQIEKLGFARKKTDHDTVSWSKSGTVYYLTPGEQGARKPGRAYPHRIPLAALKCMSGRRCRELEDCLWAR